MKREIKFRAWDTKKKKMYKPVHQAYKGKLHELFVSFSGQLVAHEIDCLMSESTFANRYILMQYTGLKDSKGVEIYESDIVQGTNDDSGCGTTTKNIVEVKWNEDICGFEPFSLYDSDCNIYTNATDVIVIGNIYQNPELLK